MPVAFVEVRRVRFGFSSPEVSAVFSEVDLADFARVAFAVVVDEDLRVRLGFSTVSAVFLDASLVDAAAFVVVDVAFRVVVRVRFGFSSSPLTAVSALSAGEAAFFAVLVSPVEALFRPRFGFSSVSVAFFGAVFFAGSRFFGSRFLRFCLC